MIDQKLKAELTLIYRWAFGIATVDFMLAAVCAAVGDKHFVWFMLLAGFMYGYGTLSKSEADKIGE